MVRLAEDFRRIPEPGRVVIVRQELLHLRAAQLIQVELWVKYARMELIICLLA